MVDVAQVRLQGLEVYCYFAQAGGEVDLGLAGFAFGEAVVSVGEGVSSLYLLYVAFGLL